MKIVAENINYRFPFKTYCNYIISIIPPNDVIGISEIRFINNFSHPKTDKDFLACYLQGNNGKNANIEVHLPNLVKHKIAETLFEFYFEIAALYLSGIISHEIGHHAHTFKRHSVKKAKHEEFADQYGRAGYHNYLLSRSNKILRSFKWGSHLYFINDKQTRESFSTNRKDIIDWLKVNTNEISFP